MRQIKFKGWNKKDRKMIDLKEITPLALDSMMMQDGIFLPFHENVVLLQFTGLKDDNGKEIYEGDCIEDISGNKLLVEWNDDTCKFQFSDGSDINDRDRYATHKVIIGNIYENAELLKEYV